MRIKDFLSVLVMLGSSLLVAACGGGGSMPSLGPSQYATSQASAGEPFTGLMPNERLAARTTAPTSFAPPVLTVAKQGSGLTLQRWKYVGGDPCNPRAGCTLEWALQKSGWPQDVQAEFLQVASSAALAEEVLLPVGWQGWMTFGKVTPKFWPNAIADFADGKPQPAQRWRVKRPGTIYNLYRVRACGNWGGDQEEGPPGPTSEIPQAWCI